MGEISRDTCPIEPSSPPCELAQEKGMDCCAECLARKENSMEQNLPFPLRDSGRNEMIEAFINYRAPKPKPWWKRLFHKEKSYPIPPKAIEFVKDARKIVGRKDSFLTFDEEGE